MGANSGSLRIAAGTCVLLVAAVPSRERGVDYKATESVTTGMSASELETKLGTPVTTSGTDCSMFETGDECWMYLVEGDENWKQFAVTVRDGKVHTFTWLHSAADRAKAAAERRRGAKAGAERRRGEEQAYEPPRVISSVDGLGAAMYEDIFAANNFFFMAEATCGSVASRAERTAGAMKLYNQAEGCAREAAAGKDRLTVVANDANHAMGELRDLENAPAGSVAARKFAAAWKQGMVFERDLQSMRQSAKKLVSRGKTLEQALESR